MTVSVARGVALLPPERVVSDVAATPDSPRHGPAAVDQLIGWLDKPDAGAEPATVASSVDGEPRALVLVGDDNADMRSHLVRLLAGRFATSAVADGAAALEVALADPPDLILTDVMMPRLDGFGLIAALRVDERTRTLPVIMLAARAGEAAAAVGIDAGADDYLVKPFSARELIARVAGTLALSRERQEMARSLRRINRELGSVSSGATRRRP